VLGWTAAAGTGPWSAWQGFVLEQLRTAPTPLAPSGSVSGPQLVFSWAEVPGEEQYILEIVQPDSSLLRNWYPASALCSAGTCSLSRSLTQVGDYSWRVQGYTAAISYGPWSSATDFTLATVRTAPTALAPTGAEAGPQVSFQWTAVAGEDWYVLQVMNPDSSLQHQWYSAASVCSGGTCTATRSLTEAGDYSWHVLGWTAASGTGPWSAWQAFSVGVGASAFKLVADTLPLNMAPSGWDLVGPWQVIEGSGWQIKGYDSSGSLSWRRAIALGGSGQPVLSFSSWLEAGGSSAGLQLSLDGQVWQTVYVIPASAGWQAAGVDLSPWQGAQVYLRFVWQPAAASGGLSLDAIQIVDLPQPTASPMPLPSATAEPATTATPLAPVAPPVLDTLDSGASAWQAEGGWRLDEAGRLGDSGLGWQVDATSAGTSTLTWTQAVDLSAAQAGRLVFYSRLARADAQALVQVQAQGSADWQTIALVAASEDWAETRVDLRPYAGQVIQLRFAWLPGEDATAVWSLDLIGVDNAWADPVPSAVPGVTPLPETTEALPPEATAEVTEEVLTEPSATLLPETTEDLSPESTEAVAPPAAATLIPSASATFTATPLPSVTEIASPSATASPTAAAEGLDEPPETTEDVS